MTLTDATTLPPINAALNGAATVLLLLAWLLIRRGRFRAHGYLMVSAFLVSTVFLALYLLHKYEHGDLGAPAELGWIRTVYYLTVLIPHVVLAMVMLPMIGVTFWHTYRRQWLRHRRIARPTFWIWMYVSVTGVLIYALLYHLFPLMVAGS
jgi:uncharacterized membrane protein YozB (DUF420 family)